MKIIDLHCDTLWKCGEDTEYSFFENDGHISEKGLVTGGYMAQCFAIFTSIKLKGEDAFNYFEERYKSAQKLFTDSENISLAAGSNQVLENAEKSKVSAILTVENGDFLNGKIERLASIDKRNFKIFGLIHNEENCLGFCHSSENANASLKSFGKEVVDAINNTGMVVDVSHLNVGGFWDVVNISKKPVIATHSACRGLKEHTRNLYDDQIKAIAKSGGVVGVPFYARFLKDDSNRTLIDDIISHIEHIVKIGGEDTPAIGTDFDGIGSELFIKNSSEMQILTEEIIKKFGFNSAEKICFKNALRIL